MTAFLQVNARRAASALVAAIALAAAPAHAGQVDGPFLIWMNFAGDETANHALHDYTHAETTADMCWTEEARLFTGGYPAEITPALVKRAVIRREPAAQARLKGLLRKGDEKRTDGYDGVIVVPKGAKPMLMSFGADGKVRSHPAMGKSGQADWPEAFCDVQPPILRKP